MGPDQPLQRRAVAALAAASSLLSACGGSGLADDVAKAFGLSTSYQVGGTIREANVTTVSVSCTGNAYTVGGTVSSLTGQGCRGVARPPFREQLPSGSGRVQAL